MSTRPRRRRISRLNESNFDGVEVVDRRVTPPSNFFHPAAVAFDVQFFDAITDFLVFNSFNIKNAVHDQ